MQRLPVMLAPLFAALACASTPQPALEPSPTPSADAGAEARGAATEAALPSDRPVELPAGQPAPWLDTRDAGDHPIGNVQIVAWGDAAALAKTDGGYFLIDDPRGLVGPIALPAGTTWVGLGDNNAVLIADAGGTLFRSAPGASLVADKPEFQEVGAVPGAAVWDAAGKTIVAGASWDEIFVSTDGGKRWRKQSVGGDSLELKEVYARYDGTAVVRAGVLGESDGDSKVYVAPRGKKLRLSKFQPSNVFKIGAFLWGNADCPVVLAKDGRWARHDVYASTSHLDVWRRAFSASAGAGGIRASALIDADTPTPPRYRASDDPGRRQCDEDEDDGGGFGFGVSGGTGQRCGAAHCLVRTMSPLEPARSGLALLGDGSCTAGVKGEYCEAPEVDRLPHAIRRESAALIAVPADCLQPVVENAPGLGILFCTGNRPLTAYALDRENRWHRETLPDALGDAAGLISGNHGPTPIAVAHGADDGTFAMVFPCESATATCRALVRLPVPAGADEAWYLLSEVGASLLPAPGGRVVAIADRNGGARIVLYSRDTKTILASGVTIPADTAYATIDGRAIRFVAGSRAEPRHYHLAENGQLIQIDAE